MAFSLMRSKPEYPLDCFQELPRLGPSWILGTALAHPPEAPLIYRLVESYDEQPSLMYELPHPLMHKDLLERLVRAGVDNIQTFPAVVHHPSRGELRDYLAFNVIGMVATSEMAARVMEDFDDFEFESDAVEGIGSNYSLIPEGIRLCRLADRMGRIIVSDDVRQQIDEGPESGLVFFGLEAKDEDHD